MMTGDCSIHQENTQLSSCQNKGTGDFCDPIRTVCFMTLGCKVNTTETEGMRHLFEAAGYRSAEDEGSADVCVINTCTVTGMGDRKSRQMIRRLRAENPGAVIAAVGCYAQVAPDEVAAVAGVDLVLGNNRKHTIVAEVESVLNARAAVNHGNAAQAEGSSGAGSVGNATDAFSQAERRPVVHVDARAALDAFEEMPIASYTDHKRAFIKIQDGCDCFCSYCIIPFARGPIRSRPRGEILAEVARFAANGYREFVLTGIHLTSYCDETGAEGLPEIIRLVGGMEGVSRIRIGSLEPMFVTDAFLDAAAASGRLCPHFHLSLQSGCARTLERMNRRYAPEEFMDIVAGIRKRMPDAAITTDIMTGFPGETLEDHEESLRFCRSVGFAQMHVFAYSPRKGTRAATMGGQIAQAEKERRAREMQAESERMMGAYRRSLTGMEAEVLVEQASGGWLFGHDRRHVPVRFPGPAEWLRRVVTVRLEMPDGDAVRAIALGLTDDVPVCADVP